MRDVERDAELRSSILKHRTRIKDLMISASQAKIIKLASKGIQTNSLAEKWGISAQNASSRLNKLFWKGYLIREQVDAPSGGFEYIYTAVKWK